MCKLQTLRALVSERLTAAAEDIFVLLERTIAEFEEENQRKQRLLDKLLLRPRVMLNKTDPESLCGPNTTPSDREIPSVRLDLGLNQEFSEFPQIKEEPEEQEEENQRPDPESRAVCVKREESLQRQRQTQGEDLSSETQTELSNDDWKRPLSCETETDGNHDPENRDRSSTLSPKHTSAPETAGVFVHNKDTTRAERFPRRKTHPCPFCKKIFVQKVHFRDHVRIHTGEKPFVCSVCERSFSRKSHLKSHMITHQEKSHECNICKKKFRSDLDLQEHISAYPGDSCLHRCPFCKSIFTQRGTLRTHLRVHTGEKPYKCSICEKTFAQTSNLKAHMAVHTGENLTADQSVRKHSAGGEASADTRLSITTSE